MNVNSPTFPSKDRVKNILREVDQARQAIEKAPAADCFESSRTRVLSKAQGNYVAGSVHHVSWMTAPDKVVATSNDGQTTVRLSSETFKKDTSGVQAAAAGIGGLVGALLGSGSDGKPKGGSLFLGAVLALAAWGSTKTIADGPGEQRIERTETTSTGITTEKVVIGEDGDSTYTSSWHRIGATPEFDAEAAKEYIKNIQLGVPAERHSI